jgi:hypothetical protein
MPAFPHTARKSHGAFEPGYTRLDTGPEPAQAMIDILAATHIDYFKSALFGKADIFDLTWSRLGLFQIVLGCKAAVKADLERITAIDLFLPIQHRDGQIHIGRIAFDNQTVQDQIGSPAGQADLVAEDRIAAVLDDHIGVRLKQRYHLVLGRNALTQHNPALSLADHFFCKIGIVLDLIQKGQCAGAKCTLFDAYGRRAVISTTLAAIVSRSIYAAVRCFSFFAFITASMHRLARRL